MSDTHPTLDGKALELPEASLNDLTDAGIVSATSLEITFNPIPAFPEPGWHLDSMGVTEDGELEYKSYVHVDDEGYIDGSYVRYRKSTARRD